MGYYTNFFLKVLGSDIKKVETEIQDRELIPAYTFGYKNSAYIPLELLEAGYNIAIGAWGDGTKWYDYDSDMKILSERYPEHSFYLIGIGENVDDKWAKLYEAGSLINKGKVEFHIWWNAD